MEITEYELFEVPPRWLFLKLETSEDIVGWGEPVVEGRSKTVKTAVEELLDTYLLGEDPRRIEDLWQIMHRGGYYRGGPVLLSAIAGVDQALWDIKGKYHGVPVCHLLGGPVRDKIRIYQGVNDDDPAEIVAEAEALVENGLTALKTGVSPDGLRYQPTPAVVDELEARFQMIREAIGDSVDLAVDFHGRVSKGAFRRIANRLEPYDPMFYEEPVLSEHNDALPTLSGTTEVPVATGERMYSRWDFKQVLLDQTVDIIQPDLSHAGGITEVKKIADMAAAFDVAIAPHCPLGPVAFAAAVQVDAACPNFLIQEQSALGIPTGPDNDRLRYLSDPTVFGYDDGFVDVPSAPGLGIDIDEDYLAERASESVDWHNPIWRQEDGSLTEW
jgi:galactonate dehydratase